MPGRNGTGPMGSGSMTGRGLGVCAGGNAARSGAGLGLGLGRGGGRKQASGRGLGFGRNSATVPTSSRTQKELLQEQKKFLESKLDAIDKQLAGL